MPIGNKIHPGYTLVDVNELGDEKESERLRTEKMAGRARGLVYTAQGCMFWLVMCWRRDQSEAQQYTLSQNHIAIHQFLAACDTVFLGC